MQSKTLFYCQAAEALSQAARNDSQAARADREAMSVGGKDSEAEAFDFSIAVVSLVLTLVNMSFQKKRVFSYTQNMSVDQLVCLLVS